MNKLLKVTLITAIMATSGMCGDRCQPYQAFPQHAPQQDSCGPMMKLALCAAAGYAVYKMCDEHHDNNKIKLNVDVDKLLEFIRGIAAKGTAGINTETRMITPNASDPTAKDYFSMIGKDVMIASSDHNILSNFYSAKLLKNSDDTFTYVIKNPADRAAFNTSVNSQTNTKGNPTAFVTTHEIAALLKRVVDIYDAYNNK